MKIEKQIQIDSNVTLPYEGPSGSNTNEYFKILSHMLVSITNIENPLEKDLTLEKGEVSQLKNAIEKKLKTLLDNRPIISPKDISPATIPHQMIIFGKTIYGVNDYDRLMGALAYLLEFIKKIVIAEGKLNFLISETALEDGRILGTIKMNKKGIKLSEIHEKSQGKLHNKESIDQITERVRRLIDSGLIYTLKEDEETYFLPTTKGLRVSL